MIWASDVQQLYRVWSLNKVDLVFSSQRRKTLIQRGMAGRAPEMGSAGQRKVREGGAEHRAPWKPRSDLRPSRN